MENEELDFSKLTLDFPYPECDGCREWDGIECSLGDGCCIYTKRKPKFMYKEEE